jgi:hypothetical protein
MMIEAYKHYDGQALGSDKVGECSGGGGEKIGDILAPSKTFHKNAYAPKPNPLRNKFDTTLDPPIFPHSTDDFQKPIKFKSDLGNEFVGKNSEKSSEEKPSEQSQPKLKIKPIRFHCEYCGRDGHKGEFCFKRKREERVAKEWANKDMYNPSHGVPESSMPLPRGKVIVRTVLSCGEKSPLDGTHPARRIKSIGPVWKPARLVWAVHTKKPVRLVSEPVRPVWK